MRKSQIAKALGAAVATAGILVTVAVPASAAGNVLSPTNCGPWSDYTCFGFAQDVPGVGASGTDVEVSCSAVSTYTVQATVVRCRIEGNTGDIHYTTPKLTQGQASTQVHRFPAWTLSSRSYRVCVAAGSYDNYGTYTAPTGYTCGANNF